MPWPLLLAAGSKDPRLYPDMGVIQAQTCSPRLWWGQLAKACVLYFQYPPLSQLLTQMRLVPGDMPEVG